jgi:hypothetical protein
MKRFLCVAWMWACAWNHAGAEPQNMKAQENTAMRIGRQLDSLEAVHSHLRVQADVLARQVDVFRVKEILSAGEHRQLEKHLRQSQVLENQMQDVESRESALWKEYRPALENLMRSYQKWVESLVERMERETDLRAKEALLQNFNDTLKRKRNCEALLYENFSAASGGRNIAAKPWDTPRDLEIKGALLLDWEDALRKEISVIDGHLRSLQKEEQVRRKAEELTLGMRMFNPSEELMGREIPVAGPDLNDYKSTDLLNRGPEGAIQAPAREGLSAEESDNRTDPVKGSWRSLSDLHDQIGQLRQLKNRLALRADTLQHRARYCTDLLDERRRQQ